VKWKHSRSDTPTGHSTTTSFTTTAIVWQLWSHQLGWELRLVIDGGELTRSQVCRSNDEILDAQEQWKAAMVGKEWS